MSSPLTRWLSTWRRPVFWLGVAFLLLALSGAYGAYRLLRPPSQDVARAAFSPKPLDLGLTDPDFALSMLAPEGAVATRILDGLAPALLVRDSLSGFSVRVARHAFFGVVQSEVLRAEKGRLADQSPPVRFLREEAGGLLFEQVRPDGRTVYDFLCVAQQGDHFYYFQGENPESFTRQQVEGMFECALGP